MEDNLIEVGVYIEEFNNKLNSTLPCIKIYQSEGLIKHIQKRHEDCVDYIDNIPEIISKPDYIGSNPKEPDSIELIKTYDKNIQIAVKLNIEKDYFYVASLYEITDAELQNRLYSGRTKKF